MIMPEIWLDGSVVRVTDGEWPPNDWPVFAWSQSPWLRALIPPAAFNPAESWYVLTGKAYNFQYGWDSALIEQFPPAGNEFWIEVLEQSPGLETYYQGGGYTPIFGTPDEFENPTPDIWMWNMGMQHNVYAVPQTFYGRLTASYKVYIGNASTGAELKNGQGQPIYTPAYVTFHWLRPCPYILEGDINYDCVVDFFDFSLVANQWLNSCNGSSPSYWCDEADMDKLGEVDFYDLDIMIENWLFDCLQTPDNPPCAPRPGQL